MIKTPTTASRTRVASRLHVQPPRGVLQVGNKAGEGKPDRQVEDDPDDGGG